MVLSSNLTDADNREVLEYDGSSGAIERWYAFGQGIDEPLNQMNVASSTRGTLIPDAQGSMVASLDSSSGTLTQVGYQMFGENPSLSSGTYQYTARRFDAETAGSSAEPSGLYYYRARMYSPTLGRFMQADPSGFQGGSNLYAYVGNDPLNLADPLGLAADNPNQFTGSLSIQSSVDASTQFTSNTSNSPSLGELRSRELGVGNGGESVILNAGLAIITAGASLEAQGLLKGGEIVAEEEGALVSEGLQFFRGAKPGSAPNFIPRPGEFKVDPNTGFVNDSHGVGNVNYFVSA